MRLTTHDKGRQPYVITANERTWREIYDKLAAYEDTGLTPETCKDIKSLCDDYVDAGLDASFILACIAAARAGISSKRMTEISKAEADNRLIILPCKVGTPVWSSVMCRFDENGEEQPMQWPFMLSMMDEWGTGFFLTYEEAEAALRKEET